MGQAISEYDSWNSVVTATRPRFEPAAFGDQKFLSIQSIQSLGQVTGEAVISARATESKPVALVEDRSEHFLKPRFPRYYFRRLFWGTLLSGGLPTYSGLDTSKSSDRETLPFPATMTPAIPAICVSGPTTSSTSESSSRRPKFAWRIGDLTTVSPETIPYSSNQRFRGTRASGRLRGQSPVPREPQSRWVRRELLR